jgi:3-hydroxyacyl-CoA dehydrogenase
MTTLPLHKIKRVAVLGSGVMGSRIACHLAQTGSEVFCSTFQHKKVHEMALPTATSKPPQSQIHRPSIPNDLHNASKRGILTMTCTAERMRLDHRGRRRALDIKQQLFDASRHIRKPGTLITSNTSGFHWRN